MRLKRLDCNRSCNGEYVYTSGIVGQSGGMVVERGCSMSQIDRIYSKAFANTPAARSADNELSTIIEKEVLSGINPDARLSKEECSELVFAASGCGERQGFISGFRYAVKLISECICN